MLAGGILAFQAGGGPRSVVLGGGGFAAFSTAIDAYMRKPLPYVVPLVPTHASLSLLAKSSAPDLTSRSTMTPHTETKTSPFPCVLKLKKGKGPGRERRAEHAFESTRPWRGGGGG